MSYDRLLSDSKEDWRRSISDVEKQQLYMLDHGIGTDCTIHVGTSNDTKVFKAHKFILIRESKFFENIFLTEKKTDVQLNDCQPWVFQILLEYLYSGVLKVRRSESKQLEDILHVTDKLHVHNVKLKCLELLVEEVNVCNIWRCFKLATESHHQRLLEACDKVIQEHTKDIIKSENFLCLPEKHLIAIVDQEFLNISEMELIDACINWSENSIKRRGLLASVHISDEQNPRDSLIRTNLLPNILPKLRFLSLTIEEFSIVTIADWLTKEEKLSIVNHILNNEKFKLTGNICKNSLNRFKSPIPISICGRALNDSMFSSLVMSVDRKTSILGIVIPSQIKNKENVHSKNSDIYLEEIKIKFYKIEEAGHRPYNVYRLELKQNINYNNIISYNSLINIKFDSPEMLDINCFYYITVEFSKKGFYPNFDRISSANYGHTSFDFSVQKGEYCSLNDGYIHSVIIVNE